MIAYKLLRLRKDGTLGPLFVDRSLVIKVGEVYVAKDNLPHPGLAHRPGFHCCAKPVAPHIKLLLKTGERRVWCKVDIGGYVKHLRPESQGGLWYTARAMRVLYIFTEADSAGFVPCGPRSAEGEYRLCWMDWKLVYGERKEQ